MRLLTTTINKTLTTLLIYMLAGSEVWAQQEEFVPYTYEGAKITILKPVERGKTGVIRVRQLDEANCLSCGEIFEIHTGTQIEFRSTRVRASSIELAEHIDKVAQVHVTKPNHIGRITFEYK